MFIKRVLLESVLKTRCKMTGLIENAFRSRLGSIVKQDKLEQLIALYGGVPEAEFIVEAGNQLSDAKLFFGFVSGVPSFRKVYGTLDDAVLDDVAGVSQKLVGISPNVAFGFLRSGNEILERVPEYCRKNVLNLANRIAEPLALWSFIEQSGRVAKGAEKLCVLNEWFEDGLSLGSSDQVAHFGYDAVSQDVLDYFKSGGVVFPVSSIVRQYGGFAVGVLGAIRDAEKFCTRIAELGEFLDYLRNPASKAFVSRFYADELNSALIDFFPPKDVLRAGFVRQKTKNLLERIGMNEEQVSRLREDSVKMPPAEFTLQDEYVVLTRYLTSLKEVERELGEAEKERSKLVKGYHLLIDDIEGKRWRLAVVKKEFSEKKNSDYCFVLNKAYDAVGNFLSGELKAELELFKDTVQDEEYVCDVIKRANLNLEQKTAALKAKCAEQDVRNNEKLQLLRLQKESWERAIKYQLRVWPITKCPRMRQKDRQTWLWLPEGITITRDEYTTEAIGEHTYITRKEWRS